MDGTGSENRHNKRVILPTKLGGFAGFDGAVRRECLEDVVRKLARGPDLVLVVAPAGYGKSTFLSQLRERMDDMRASTGWVSLEADDNNPLRFLSYLAAAVSEAVPGLGDDALAQLGSVMHSPHAAFDTLIADITSSLERVIVFLDDYHLISNLDVHAQVRAILKHAAPRLRLVIGTRSEPSLPLAALRSRGALLEIGTHELSFNTEEALALARLRGLDALGPEEIARLRDRTEGWVIGMQLCFLAVGDESEGEKLLSELTGRDRDIADYLGDAVLDRQPNEVREFLLATAPLDRICADLAEVVAPGSSGQSMLERIEASGLFLVPLDRRRRWFRYHHLFSEFLRARVERDAPGRLDELRKLAARWSCERGLEDEGVKYALAARDLDFAAERIAAYAYDLVQRRGDHHTLLRWMEALPEEHLDRWPAIRLGHAWSLTFTRDHEGAEKELTRLDALAETAVAGSSVSVDEIAQFAAMVRCVLSALTERHEESRDQSIAWLERWPHAPPFNKGTVLNALAYAYNSTFDFEIGLREIVRARAEFERSNSPYGAAWAMAIEGMLLTSTGALSAARSVLEEAIAYSEKMLGARSHCASIASLLLSEVHYEQNDLAAAKQRVEQGMLAVREVGAAEFLESGYSVGARLRFADGEIDHALSLLEEGRRLGIRYDMPRVTLALALEGTRLLLIANQLERASRHAKLAGLVDSSEPVDVATTELQQRAQARLLVATGQGKAALALLNPMIAAWRNQGRKRFLLTGLVLKSAALAQWGAENEALRHLDQALQLGAEAGNIRRVADEGYLVAPLFARYLEMRASPTVSAAGRVGGGYLRALSTALGMAVRSDADGSKGADKPVESLSTKEAELLGLVERGLSNREIADTLFISEKTVKWHLHNVFGKLGVRNRTSAVAVARRMDMLS